MHNLDHIARGEYKFKDGKIIQIHHKLGADQILVPYIFNKVANESSMLELLKILYEALENSEGQLENVNSIRNVFFDALRQWANKDEIVFPDDDIYKGITGIEVADAMQDICRLIDTQVPPIQMFFHGVRLSEQILKNIKSSAESYVNHISKKGQFYRFCIVSLVVINGEQYGKGSMHRQCLNNEGKMNSRPYHEEFYRGVYGDIYKGK